MKALIHLKKRLEWSAKNNKPLWVNEDDLNSLNELIDFFNGNKPRETELEDALMLFYILQNWKIENKYNEWLTAIEEKKSIMKLTDSGILLEKLSLSLRPKENIITEIWHELRLYQAMNNTSKEQRISKKAVKEFLENILQRCKKRFPILKAMSESGVIFSYELGENRH